MCKFSFSWNKNKMRFLARLIHRISKYWKNHAKACRIMMVFDDHTRDNRMKIRAKVRALLDNPTVFIGLKILIKFRTINLGIYYDVCIICFTQRQCPTNLSRILWQVTSKVYDLSQVRSKSIIFFFVFFWYENVKITSKKTRQFKFIVKRKEKRNT